jgi:hypothetical protein
MRSLSLSRMTDADNDAKTDILLPLFEKGLFKKRHGQAACWPIGDLPVIGPGVPLSRCFD